MRLIEMVRKKSKHHSLCDVIRLHFETKRDKKRHMQFYNVVKEEDHYFLQKVRNGQPIQGECDVAAMRYFNGRKVGVLVEVKSHDSNKHYHKALRQLAKDKAYYQQLYKLDKVYCLYAYGEVKDKSWSKINYHYVPRRVVDSELVK